MIKKKNDKGELILFQENYHIESSDRPDFLVLWIDKENIGTLFKSQDAILQIKDLGDGEDKIVNIKNGKKIKLTIEVIEDEKE